MVTCRFSKVPTAEYITVCRPNGKALLEGDLPRAVLDDLLAHSFVKQDGQENDRHVTVFPLTPEARALASKKNPPA
jgi:hypothetical protein